MFLKQLDCLSPTITVYYKGYLSHSSIFSALLSIFSYVLIILIAITFSLDLILRQNPTSFYFNRFEEDAGIFALNTSSFFHFISLSINLEANIDEGVDFHSFRIIGLETYYFNYILTSRNISNFDHWLYGYCNKEKDIEGISNLVNHTFIQKSACIRKYFNSKEQKYYDTWEPNFRWPVMAHGVHHSDNKFYCIILEKCEEETINLILNGNNHCRRHDEIKEIIGYNSVAQLFFIDKNIDVLNYKNPITKFLYSIDNYIEIDGYIVNYMYFFPSLVKTHNGLVFDKINKELSFTFERNEAAIYYDNDVTYAVYYLWLNNRMNYYERSYKRIQDIISSIGGIFHFITFVSIFINGLYNNYILLSDTENLLNSLIDFEKNMLYHFKTIKKDTKKMQDINNKKNEIKSSNKRGFNYEDSKHNINTKINDKNFSKSNNFCITDNKDTIINNINQVQKKNKKDDNKKDEYIKNFKKINHYFWQYALFKFSFEKKYISFKAYQKFRIKILSEEHVIRNHLNIYNLLRINKRKMNLKRCYSYQLKDLINII